MKKAEQKAKAAMKYTDEERRLANLARQMAMRRNVLYRGTRYAQSILRTGVLFTPSIPSNAPVSLTRSPEVAAYFALRVIREDDEGRGGILIFDREQLHRKYKIYPVEEREVEINWLHDEAEEEIWDDVTDISKYLIGFVSESATLYSDKLKALNGESRIRTEDRLDDLLYFVPDWRVRSKERVEAGLKKSELARNALFAGVAIPQVAKQVGLKESTVRRLAGSLQRRASCNIMGGLNWSWPEIVSTWDLRGLSKQFSAGPKNRVILPADLAAVFGEDRIKALMTYCGMSRDDVLKTLKKELPRLMKMDADANLPGCSADSEGEMIAA